MNDRAGGLGRADVAVIGGGPAGSATALLLARQGLEVTVLERAAFPRPKLCGDYINPAGSAVLADLGVLPALLPAARRLEGMLVVSPRGRQVLARFPHGHGLSLPREVLDQTLLDAAADAGATVRTSCAVREMVTTGAGWQIETTQGELAATMVVGADGFRSAVRGWAGLRGGPPRRGRYALGYYIRDLHALVGAGEMHLAHDGYCGVAPFADGRANVTMVVDRGWLRGRTHSARRGPPQPERLFARFPVLGPRVRDAAIVEGPRAVGPLAPAHGDVVGHAVVLVGDAAAFTDPLTGQGVTHALSGAVVAAGVIGHAVRAGDVSATRLAPYARWHRARMRAVWGLLWLVDRLALRSGLIEPLMRAWERDRSLAPAFMGVIGGGDPPARLVRPAYAARLVRACTLRA